MGPLTAARRSTALRHFPRILHTLEVQDTLLDRKFARKVVSRHQYHRDSIMGLMDTRRIMDLT